MKFNEFREEAKRTMVDLGEKMNLAHMVLGMNTELEELVTSTDVVNTGEELADIAWYLANYMNLRKIEFFPALMEDRVFDAGNLVGPIAELQNIIKGYIAYDKPINIIKEKKMLGAIMEALILIAFRNNIKLEDCLERNIAKLRVRYPDKFSKDRAIERDTRAEREVLRP